MFVYGVRCAPNDLMGLPADANADYYMDYGILLFPEFTRPPTHNAKGHLTPWFWSQVSRTVSTPYRVLEVDQEDPFLDEGQVAVIRSLQEAYPSLQPTWYYVPRVRLPSSESDQSSEVDSESEVDQE